MKNKGFSQNTKEKVRQRDNHKCFFCDGKENLTIGHIFSWRCENGMPVEKNGMTICRKCHDKLDFGIGVSRQEQIKMLRLCEIYLIFLYMEELDKDKLTYGGKQKAKRKAYEGRDMYANKLQGV